MAELAYGIAGNILERLRSHAFELEISLAWGMHDDLEKLKQTTSTLRVVLNDAEKKQERNELLRIWLKQLKDAFYDAQDLLDEFECEIVRSQVVKEYGSFGRKVRRFFSRSNPLAFRFSIAHQIKDIRQKFDDIAKNMASFQLVTIAVNHDQSHVMQGRREMTHSFINDLEVIGRENDKVRIIDALTQGNKSDTSPTVIPIVGIAGLGKTTLAKLIYNDKRVVTQFDLRLWVCVPLDFNFTETVREILKSAISDRNALNQSLRNTTDISNLSIDQLQMFLRSILEDKKFLLVFDDVWNEDRSKWNELRSLLTVLGGKDSKIVVTTRNTSVASIMGTVPPYNLECLSEEDSMALFLKCAFGDTQLADQFPQLKYIGNQIVEKCKGVPLAVKTLGTLLHSRTEEREWISIRDNEIWELKVGDDEDDNHILSALRLSYSTMPSHLKQCFPYCSLVPKGSRMHSLDLISIWMALGILQQPNDEIEIENVGKLYFEELAARSFFQYLSDPDEFFSLSQEFEVHDLIHDLALSIMQHEHSMLNSGTETISENARYLSIFLNDNHGQSILRALQKLKKVRGIFVKYQTNGTPDIHDSFLSTCISRSKYLRFLNMDSLSFDALPSSIGRLKHLRYLNLCENKKIKNLPNSITKLQSLQSLQSLGLLGCTELEELPSDIRNLINLRILTVSTKQTFFPENGIGRLKSLQFLTLDRCKNLKSLPQDMRYCTKLSTLITAECEQLELASEARPEPGPIDEVIKLSLQTLLIVKLPKTTALSPWLQGAAHTLQLLVIGDCPKLTGLPEWLPKLTSLKKLAIADCSKLSSLPNGMQLLTSLTHLQIRRCHALQERCQREIGEDWPKIAHVRNKEIDGLNQQIDENDD